MSTNLIKINEHKHGFLDFGAAAADCVTENRDLFEEFLARRHHGSMSYLERNLEKRFDPRLLVPDARSVLCFLAPYGQAGGGVAGFAQGIDYHKVVKDRLFAQIVELKEQFPSFSGRPFVDSAPLLERWWAVRCGLGFIGRNHFFISPKYGLRTIIGVIVCNIPAELFPPHEPLAVTDCGGCGRCLEACPTGALREKAGFDARKCISYRTVESHDPADASADAHHGWKFGCEECMRACPWDKPLDPLPEFETHRDRIAALSAAPEGKGWAALDPESFASEFGDSGLTRAGLEKLSH